MLDDHGERGRHTDQPLAAPECGRENERWGGYLAEWHTLNIRPVDELDPLSFLFVTIALAGAFPVRLNGNGVILLHPAKGGVGRL